MKAFVVLLASVLLWQANGKVATVGERINGHQEPGIQKLDDHNGGTADKLGLGCFPDIFSHTALSHLLWNSPYNSASGCIRACRQQHFKFAGLQNGLDCFCGNGEVRGEFWELNDTETDSFEDTCTTQCPGEPSENCGGPGSNALYLVPHDRRYLGCFHDNPNLPDLSTKQWGENANRSAEDCVHVCTTLGFHYSGVQNGGACFCGNSYGRYGGQEEELCNVTCVGYTRQNCGGEDANAVYITERADAMADPDPLIFHTFDATGTITDVNLGYFSQLENLRSIATRKFVMTASDIISTPNKTECMNNCYEPCGEIYHPDGFDNKGENLVIRVFHLRFQDLHNYVAADTRRLFVYAQTVVVDVSLQIDYALQIRAREIVLDRDRASEFSVTVSAEAPELGREDVDIEAQPELMFMKQSIMCARILLDTKTLPDYNLALAITDDIANTPSDDEEVIAFVEQVQTVITEIVGVLRADIHYVPFYTKTHMSQILETYSVQISIYKEELDRIIDRNLAYESYVSAIRQMNQIYTETDVEEAKAALDSALVTVMRSNATYRTMYVEYENASAEMVAAQEVFENNLQGAISEAKRRASVSFGSILRRGIRGAIRSAREAAETAKLLEAAAIRVENLANSMYEVSKMTEAIMKMSDFVDELITRLADYEGDHDVMQYNDDVEAVVALYVNLVQWQNFLDNCNIVMTDRDLAGIGGAQEYHLAMQRVAHWGRGVTEGAIELAESIRIATEKRLILQAKIKQQERIEELMDELQDELEHRERMTYAMFDQMYDVRLDLNGALVTFCQAFFFENLYVCKDQYKPSFGGSLQDLLLKINAARKDALLIGDIPSTVQRRVRIQDNDTSATCDHMELCPVNFFRKHRIMYYTMPLNHRDLWDLDKYRVADVKVVIEGATYTPDLLDNTLLKLIIESTGEFRGRSRDVVYSFLSRGVSLLNEYDLDDGTMAINGDVYSPYRNIVSHVTPYTTWVIRVSEDRSHNVDVSQITGFTLVLRGSAVNSGG